MAAAQDRSHPWHDRKDWQWDDDAEAAKRHRLTLARELITDIEFVTTDAPLPVRIPYYVHPGSPRAGYVPTRSLEDDAQGALALLTDELARVGGALRRALNLAAHLKVSLASVAADIPGLTPLVAQLHAAIG